MSETARICAECGCRRLAPGGKEPEQLWALTSNLAIYCAVCAEVSIPPIPPYELGLQVRLNDTLSVYHHTVGAFFIT